VGRCRLDAPDSGQDQMTGSCEIGNELLISIKGGEFLDFD
jgi:hypothetical protein